jgi:hypothetical protein
VAHRVLPARHSSALAGAVPPSPCDIEDVAKAVGYPMDGSTVPTG